MAKKSKIKEITQALFDKKKYPKKDGGVLALSSDEGDVIILRSGDRYSYEFLDKNRIVTVFPDGKMIEKATSTEAGDAKPEGTAKLIPKNVKGDEEAEEPIMVEQMDYAGNPEEVDFRTYSNVINCEVCGAVRYVRNGDIHEVTMCKPCARKERRRRHRKSRKLRGVAKNKPMPQTVVDKINNKNANKGKPPLANKK